MSLMLIFWPCIHVANLPLHQIPQVLYLVDLQRLLAIGVNLDLVKKLLSYFPNPHKILLFVMVQLSYIYCWWR